MFKQIKKDLGGMGKGAKGCEIESVGKSPGATAGYTCEEVC